MRSTTATPAISSTIHESFNNLETMPYRAANIAPYPPSHPSQMTLYSQHQSPVSPYAPNQYGQRKHLTSPTLSIMAPRSTFYLNAQTNALQHKTTRHQRPTVLLSPPTDIQMTLRRCTGHLRCTSPVWEGLRGCLLEEHPTQASRACSPGTLLGTVLAVPSVCTTRRTRSVYGSSCRI